MELYNIYQTVLGIMSLYNKTIISTSELMITSAVIAFLVWAGLFVLYGIGLSTMAKKRDIGKRWLAFVPFANLYYLGRLAGDCDIFGQKMKRAGLYVMLAQIVTTLLYLAMAIFEGVLLTQYVDSITIDGSTGDLIWTSLTGFAEFMRSYYSDWGLLLCSIAGLAYELLVFIVMMALLKKYSAKNTQNI